MNLDILLYIVAAMTFYDFTIHVIEYLKWQHYFLGSRSPFSYYYPHFAFKKVSGGFTNRENFYTVYQTFWTVYWGLAFLLVVAYLILK